MYLVSVYFDEKTNVRIQQYIDEVARKSENTFMVDNEVPPHLTVSAFETRQEDKMLEVFRREAETFTSGMLQWASIGIFLPSVIYLAPVWNEYLHTLSGQIYERITQIEDSKVSPYYRPMQWMPHTTIGKRMSKEEMRIAFEVLQNQFGIFQGQVTGIGLAKTNPYRNLIFYPL